METRTVDAGAPYPTLLTLALPQLMATSGQYPARGDGGTTA